MSIAGCKIEIVTDFPNEEDKRRKRKDPTMEAIETKIDSKFSKLMLKTKNNIPKDNIIQENIRKITYWNRINEQNKEEKSRLFEHRRQEAMKKKEQMQIGIPSSL